MHASWTLPSTLQLKFCPVYNKNFVLDLDIDSSRQVVQKQNVLQDLHILRTTSSIDS